MSDAVFQTAQDWEDLANAVGNRVAELNDREPTGDKDQDWQRDELIKRLEVLLDKCNDQHREMVLEAVRERYDKRINDLLIDLVERLEREGYVIGAPFTMHDDVFRWTIDGHTSKRAHADNDDTQRFDLTFEVPEANVYGEDSFYGINFGINIVENGGAIIGGLSPYNFTDDIWVDARDDDAVEARFKLIEDADREEAVSVIINHYKETEAA